MTPDHSLPDFEEALLARFLQELETATDRAAVVERYAAQHPSMAEELARLEEMNRLVTQAGNEVSRDEIPRQLGEFRIIRRIARGGMGDIYEAVQDRLNRRVAVKTIRRGRISVAARGRFFREQRVLARLHQTHILPIHAAGEESDLLYFVMPFIDGAPLNQVVRAVAEFGSSSKTPSLTALAERVNQTDHEPTKSTEPERSRRSRAMSTDYFRSVARVMAEVAEAIEHAHRMNILHRDLKPSNILLDRQGECWIIDFGLAGYIGQVSAPVGESANDDGEALTTDGILGTPQYMSPEQWRGEPAGVRSDVWGLGATLYELLTLRRAFDTRSALDARERILNDQPPALKLLMPNIPTDLAAVCQKALRKDAAERYSSAQAMADDLRRWLRHEPVAARPARSIRRVGLWARRNPGWAAAVVCIIGAAAAMITAAVIGEQQRVANKQLEFAASRARMQEIQRLRVSMAAGWRTAALKVANEIRARQPGDDLRDATAALHVGLDAHLAATLPLAASSAAIDPTGAKLLLGGWNDNAGRPESGARLIDLASSEVVKVSPQAGAGPVTFRSDGMACQLVPKDAGTILLWDVGRRQAISQFSTGVSAAVELTQFIYPIMALSADGTRAAAAIKLPDGTGTTIVWDTVTGRRLRDWNRKAECLALTADGTMLAAGEKNGQIVVESLNSGAPSIKLQSGSVAITSLAFGLDPVRENNQEQVAWRLASGDAGTRVTVWDLATGQHRCHCDGLMYGASSLAFSPDGMSLVTTGRGAGLWDAATGQRLLELPGHVMVNGSCFAPDGRRLVLCTPPLSTLTQKSRTEIWNLELGRGTTMLGGLFGPAAKAVFSIDGKYVAALSHQWQVAIWNLPEHRLLHVFEGPQGEFVDNAALVFDHNATRLACAGGKQAFVWDLATGRTMTNCEMPVGLQDALAFAPEGRHLWSVRCETITGVPPYSHADYKEHRRIYPIRDLLKTNPREPIKVIETPDDHVSGIVMALDGSIVGINGFCRNESQRRHTLRAFAVPSGSPIWEKACTDGTILPDPIAKGWTFYSIERKLTSVNCSTGLPIRSDNSNMWSLDGSLLKGGGRIIAQLDLNQQLTGQPQFSPCGRLLVGCRRDGYIIVYELDSVRRQHAAE